jgi:hypothetical protein
MNDRRKTEEKMVGDRKWPLGLILEWKMMVVVMMAVVMMMQHIRDYLM